MAERQLEELRSHSQKMESQVEISLSQSNEKMSQVLRESRSLETERVQLVERTEKLRLAQTKIQTIEKELSEKKELLAAADNMKKKLTLEKSELEDKEFNLSNRLKQTEMRLKSSQK